MIELGHLKAFFAFGRRKSQYMDNHSKHFMRRFLSSLAGLVVVILLMTGTGMKLPFIGWLLIAFAIKGAILLIWRENPLDETSDGSTESWAGHYEKTPEFDLSYIKLPAKAPAIIPERPQSESEMRELPSVSLGNAHPAEPVLTQTDIEPVARKSSKAPEPAKSMIPAHPQAKSEKNELPTVGLAKYHAPEPVKAQPAVIPEGPWEFEFVLTDEKMRKRIVRHVNPRYVDSFSHQNLNLAYGVADKEKTIFLTLSYLVTRSIKRNDDNFDDYKYVVLTGNTAFTVYSEGEITLSRGFEAYQDIVSEAIAFYENYKEEKAFEARLKDETPDFSLIRLNGRYKEEIMDSIKETYPISSVSDAKGLYLTNHCNSAYLQYAYSAQTLLNYCKFADEKAELAWRSEEYERKLREIVDRRFTHYQYLGCLDYARRLCEQGISDNNEELYIKAWETLFHDKKIEKLDFHELKDYIDMYMTRFEDRAAKLQPLLELADDYIWENFPDCYKNTQGYSYIHSYNKAAESLRERIASNPQ